MNLDGNDKRDRHGRAWAAGIGSAAIILMGNWAWNSITSRTDAVQTIQAHHGERISKVETEITGLRESLIRIERKLDQVLEKR